MLVTKETVNAGDGSDYEADMQLSKMHHGATCILKHMTSREDADRKWSHRIRRGCHCCSTRTHKF